MNLILKAFNDDFIKQEKISFHSNIEYKENKKEYSKLNKILSKSEYAYIYNLNKNATSSNVQKVRIEYAKIYPKVIFIRFTVIESMKINSFIFHRSLHKLLVNKKEIGKLEYVPLLCSINDDELDDILDLKYIKNFQEKAKDIYLPSDKEEYEVISSRNKENILGKVIALKAYINKFSSCSDSEVDNLDYINSLNGVVKAYYELGRYYEYMLRKNWLDLINKTVNENSTSLKYDFIEVEDDQIGYLKQAENSYKQCWLLQNLIIARIGEKGLIITARELLYKMAMMNLHIYFAIVNDSRYSREKVYRYLEKALSYFKNSINSDYKNVSRLKESRIREKIARIYIILNKYDKAVYELECYMKDSNVDASIVCTLLFAYYLKGDYKEVVKLFENKRYNSKNKIISCINTIYDNSLKKI